jgi:hypothetical protein
MLNDEKRIIFSMTTKRFFNLVRETPEILNLFFENQFYVFPSKDRALE